MRYWKYFAGTWRRPKQTVLALLMSLFFIGNALADRQQALTTQASGDYANAAKLWLQMANDGDPLAQYNLALLYERGVGVIPDNNLTRYWFSMAARHGMVEAYSIVNAQSVQPMTRSPSKYASFSTGPEEWVTTQNPNYYTLQLASSTNKALIEKYYGENDLIGKAGYYRSRRAGEDWYALVYGAYPSMQEANAAIVNLPADLKKWSPWVRNIKSIQRIMMR